MSVKKVITVSVRNLLNFTMRTGDLSYEFGGASRLQEGSQIHRKLQKSYGSSYTPEVTLAITVALEDIDLQIKGRADGVIVTFDKAGSKQVVIDEIKTTNRDLAEIEEAENPLYWAQVKCYAYMYAMQYDLDLITVQLSYCQSETLHVRKFDRLYRKEELSLFFQQLVLQYTKWANRANDWIEKRNISAAKLVFPFFKFRDGQRELSIAVYRTLILNRKLFAQAPTGTGKTMATLFAAIKAMEAGGIERIFFLTAKTITRSLADEAVDKLRQGGLAFKTVTITAKDKICFLPEAKCKPDECPYAKGYYDRVMLALENCWNIEKYNREVIEAYSRLHKLCPFEFSLDLALWADAVICDYNYVFDPRVNLRRFFSGTDMHSCLLVDEAHNLVDRAREMFSAEISRQAFVNWAKHSRGRLPKMAKAAGRISSFLRKQGKSCTESVNRDEVAAVYEAEPKELYPLVRKFTALAEKQLADNEQSDLHEELLDMYFAAVSFLKTAELYDGRYKTYVCQTKSDIRLKLFCVNPAYLLHQVTETIGPAVFFSATLMPLNYFRRILGGEEADGILAVGSPFAPENLCLLAATYVQTTYKDRQTSYDAVIESIAAALQEKNGNYLVFFPSYAYMEKVHWLYSRRYPSVKTICQACNMTEDDKAAFLEHFSDRNTETILGFVVLGGVFGEGIDLTGDRLIGAIIIGVGLPQVCLEREVIRDWFKENERMGFDYAYAFPGMNKVLQAAGRVIRTETDRGIVLLLDKRFSQTRYRKLFPDEWHKIKMIPELSLLSRGIKDFWNSFQGK